MRDGRVSWADLGRELDLSPAATAERVKRLERNGVIKGYTAIVDADAVGLGVSAFVFVTLESPGARKKFLGVASALPDVLEAHHVTGDHDYLLRVRAADLKALDTLINEELKKGGGIVRSHTTIVLGTTKETTELPLGP